MNQVINVIRNYWLNSMGVDRDLERLLADRDISRAMALFQDRDTEVLKALKEYLPECHAVLSRPDKRRKGRDDYKVQKLPRAWQKQINRIAQFFLLNHPVKWTCENTDEASIKAFNAFLEFLKEIRFDVYMRHAKMTAGAETECAKLYHIYRDEETNSPRVKIVMLAYSDNYTIRPLFDQYKNLIAFGYGYRLKEGADVVEHFDIQTPKKIYRCRKEKPGWSVNELPNVTGKINVIYYRQDEEWKDAQWRIERDEMLDSRNADTNEYYGDPIAKVSADVVKGLTDPESVGKMIQLQGKESVFEYVTLPDDSPTKGAEKKVLRESILSDTLTPDFDFEKMAGLGTLSGEALRRALISGYIKRNLNIDTYQELVDREKNLILAIMMNVTHIELREALRNLKIG
ncbi:MAG: phage portal protein, partial [Tannerella sp.]|nr:phage portal protein [Tannerella sp.]